MVLILGFTAILGKLIEVEVYALVWYRILIAIVGIAIYMLIWKRSFIIPGQALLTICLSGLILSCHWLLFFSAIKVSNVSITLVCLSISPLIVSFLEPLAFKRQIRKYEVVFSIIVVIGLGFIFRIETGYSSGIILALSAAFLSSVLSIINAKLILKYSSPIISFYELVGGLIGLSLYIAVIGIEKSRFVPSIPDVGYLLILGLICTAFAYIKAVEVMKVLSPYTVMLTINMEPVYGIVLALLIFGESEYMQSGFYAGAGLIFLTILGNNLINRNRL